MKFWMWPTQSKFSFSNIWITVVTPSDQSCFQPTTLCTFCDSCLSVWPSTLNSIILSKCEFRKILATLCLESWLDLMMSKTQKGARAYRSAIYATLIVHLVNTFIDGWSFRQKKVHTYLCMYRHKKGLFTQKRLSTNFRFLKLCMIEERYIIELDTQNCQHYSFFCIFLRQILWSKVGAAAVFWSFDNYYLKRAGVQMTKYQYIARFFWLIYIKPCPAHLLDNYFFKRAD